MDLLEKAFSCATSDQKQEHGVKQFVCGLTDEKLQEKLITKDDLVSLKGTVQVAKQLRAKENVLEAVRGTRTSEVVMTASHRRGTDTCGNETKFSQEDADPKCMDMKEQLSQIQNTITQLKITKKRYHIREPRGAPWWGPNRYRRSDASCRYHEGRYPI